MKASQMGTEETLGSSGTLCEGEGKMGFCQESRAGGAAQWWCTFLNMSEAQVPKVGEGNKS